MDSFLRPGRVISATPIGLKGGSGRFNGEGVCGVGSTGECCGRSLVGDTTYSAVSWTAVSGVPRGSADSEEGCGAAEGTATLEDPSVRVSRDADATDASS